MKAYSKNTIIISIFLMAVNFIFPKFYFAQGEDDTEFKIGGAVRYNLFLELYEDENITADDAQFTWDTWRLNVRGKTNGLILDFEYRFYPTFGTHFIHHGWIGYNFSDATQLQLGVTQVPFGDQPYSSHSWWFSTSYYVGLEDDYDIGFKLTHQIDNLDLAFAYFMQAEPQGPSYGGDVNFSGPGSGRYSYDIVEVEGESNQERNQFNARAAYTFDHSESASTEVGLSAQFGQIYNRVIDDFGTHNAIGLHLNGNYGQFNVKAHAENYTIDAKNDDGEELDLVHMGAYGFPYQIAAEASIATLGVSYSLPVKLGPISNITFYNDYSVTKKAKDEFADTQQNTIGMLVTAGSIYTYFDIASGKNQPWLTNNFGAGLDAGSEDAEWNTRLNINVGYYF